MSSQSTPPLSVLWAPAGQLSGDGQLRELIQERRNRPDGGAAPRPGLWYLPPALVEELGLLAEPFPTAQPREAVLGEDPAVITWLGLRFGGNTDTSGLSPAVLQERAAALPPPPPPPPVGPAEG